MHVGGGGGYILRFLYATLTAQVLVHHKRNDDFFQDCSACAVINDSHILYMYPIINGYRMIMASPNVSGSLCN